LQRKKERTFRDAFSRSSKDVSFDNAKICVSLQALRVGYRVNRLCLRRIGPLYDR